MEGKKLPTSSHIQHYKQETSSILSVFVRHFCLLDPDADPADQTQCGSMRIRIKNTHLIKQSERMYKSLIQEEGVCSPQYKQQVPLYRNHTSLQEFNNLLYVRPVPVPNLTDSVSFIKI